MTAPTTTPPDTLPSASDLYRRGWSTPFWLLVLGSGAVLLAVLIGVFTGTAAAGARSGVEVIGRQAAPQVQVTSDLYFALADLDAQAANVLLVGTEPKLAQNRAAALTGYEQRRKQVDADLDRAAADAGADQAARTTMIGTIDQLGRYESLTTEAFLLNQQGNDPAGRPSTAVLTRYRQATEIMAGVLTGVQSLTDRNHALLNATYDRQRSAALADQIWLGVLGFGLVGVLVALQGQLRLRLRRRGNPALLAATAVTVVFTIVGISVFGVESGNLRLAKADAFDSVVALSTARSVSYDANADESRFLVDEDLASPYQQAFLAKSRSLLDPAGSVAMSGYKSGVDDAVGAYLRNPNDVRFTGFFGTEVRNLTFPGEREAADRVLAAYQTYQHDDHVLRVFQAQGNLSAAINLDIGTTPGNSDYDFNQYDDALAALIHLNQQAFDGAIDSAVGTLAGWTVTIPLLATLVLLALTGIGLYPRLAEYR